MILVFTPLTRCVSGDSSPLFLLMRKAHRHRPYSLSRRSPWQCVPVSEVYCVQKYHPNVRNIHQREFLSDSLKLRPQRYTCAGRGGVTETRGYRAYSSEMNRSGGRTRRTYKLACIATVTTAACKGEVPPTELGNPSGESETAFSNRLRRRWKQTTVAHRHMRVDIPTRDSALSDRVYPGALELEGISSTRSQTWAIHTGKSHRSLPHSPPSNGRYALHDEALDDIFDG